MLTRFLTVLTVLVICTSTVTAGSCDSDLDVDGDVDFGDLLEVLNAWGPCDACDADIDMNGDVAFGDLLAVLGAWGLCPQADLNLEIIAAPSHAMVGTFVDWRISVRNVGGRTSASTCLLTGINCDRGAGQWNFALDLRTVSVPPIDADGAWMYHVGGYAIPFNAYPLPQWIKVEIDTNSNCSDPPPGNDDDHRIEIFWP